MAPFFGASFSFPAAANPFTIGKVVSPATLSAGGTVTYTVTVQNTSATTALTGTLRQRMEQHRQDPNCASCHARMDPIGFGFENFNAIGAWRDIEGDLPIDPSGQLVTGESLHGPAERKNILLKGKRNQYVRCLTEKLLTYALGRGLAYNDKCAVDQISQKLAKEHFRFTALVLGVVHSTPFQMTRGQDPTPTLALQSNEPQHP